LVKLNSIANSKANITVQAINESITLDTTNGEVQKQEEAVANATNNNGLEGNTTAGGAGESSGSVAWAWIIVILVLVAGGITWFFLTEKGKKGKKK